jgi:hypothetical protein
MQQECVIIPDVPNCNYGCKYRSKSYTYSEFSLTNNLYYYYYYYYYTAVVIRHADHVAPSIRKRHQLDRQAAVA